MDIPAKERSPPGLGQPIMTIAWQSGSWPPQVGPPKLAFQVLLQEVSPGRPGLEFDLICGLQSRGFVRSFSFSPWILVSPRPSLHAPADLPKSHPEPASKRC